MSVGGKVGRRAMPIRACAMYDTSSPSILAPRRTRTDYHGAGHGTAGTVGTYLRYGTMVGTVESILQDKGLFTTSTAVPEKCY